MNGELPVHVDDGDMRIEELVEQYKSELAELTFNSKPIITNLTIIAGENVHAAKAIAAAICDHVLKVPKEHKLPSLYLLDSIVKNEGGEYIEHFSRRLPEVFLRSYEQMDPPTHASLLHLFQTWAKVFPSTLLRSIEARRQGLVQQMQAANPPAGLAARALESPGGRIHVNPKYLEAQAQRQRLEQAVHGQGQGQGQGSTDTWLNGTASRLHEDAAYRAGRDPASLDGRAYPVHARAAEAQPRNAYWAADGARPLAGRQGQQLRPLRMATVRNGYAGRGDRQLHEVDMRAYERTGQGGAVPRRDGRAALKDEWQGWGMDKNGGALEFEDMSPSWRGADADRSRAGDAWQSVARAESQQHWPRAVKLEPGLAEHSGQDLPEWEAETEPGQGGGGSREMAEALQREPQQRLTAVGAQPHQYIKSEQGLALEQRARYPSTRPTATPPSAAPFRPGVREAVKFSEPSARSAAAGLPQPVTSPRQHTFVSPPPLAAEAPGRPPRLPPPQVPGSARVLQQQALPLAGARHAEVDRGHRREGAPPAVSSAAAAPLAEAPPQVSPKALPIPLPASDPQVRPIDVQHLQQLLLPLQHSLPPQAPRPATPQQAALPAPAPSSPAAPPSQVSTAEATSSGTAKTGDSAVNLMSNPMQMLTALLQAGITLPLPAVTQPPPQPSSSLPSALLRTPPPTEHQAALLSTELQRPSPPSTRAAQPPLPVAAMEVQQPQPAPLLPPTGPPPPGSASQPQAFPLRPPLPPGPPPSSAPPIAGNPMPAAPVLPQLGDLFSSLLKQGVISVPAPAGPPSGAPLPSAMPAHALVGTPPLPAYPPPLPSMVAMQPPGVGVPLYGMRPPLPATPLPQTAPPGVRPIGREFRQDVLKERHEEVITSLYSDFKHQCATCGLRFQEQDAYGRHLDDHYQKRVRQKKQKAQSRMWYAMAKDWLSGTAGQPAQASTPFFSAEEPASRAEEQQALHAVPADESQTTCALCGDEFEQFYSHEADQWMYRGAVYLNGPPPGNGSQEDPASWGPIVHAKCCADSAPQDASETDAKRQRIQ